MIILIRICFVSWVGLKTKTIFADILLGPQAYFNIFIPYDMMPTCMPQDVKLLLCVIHNGRSKHFLSYSQS